MANLVRGALICLLLLPGCREQFVDLASSQGEDSEPSDTATGADGDTASDGDIGSDSPVDSETDSDTGSASVCPGATFEVLSPDSCSGPPTYDCEESLDGVVIPKTDSCSDIPVPVFCDFTTAGCETSGCISNFVLRYDFNGPVSVEELWFLSDWHSKRPGNFELWVGQTVDETPGNGALLALSGYGTDAPWACVTGEPCTWEVPDACCPNGRDQPQDTLDVGDMYAKWDRAIATAPLVGTYWYFVVVDSQYPPALILKEVELHGRVCDQ